MNTFSPSAKHGGFQLVFPFLQNIFIAAFLPQSLAYHSWLKQSW